MRQPQNAKRGRGRGRRGNGNNNHHNHVPNRNTSYESNGPDVKLRGNAQQQLHEKYMALAHDAASAGERISAEAYTQFADHYFRLHQAAVGVAETKRQQDLGRGGCYSRSASSGRCDDIREAAYLVTHRPPTGDMRQITSDAARSSGSVIAADSVAAKASACDGGGQMANQLLPSDDADAASKPPGSTPVTSTACRGCSG